MQSSGALRREKAALCLGSLKIESDSAFLVVPDK
jgi:hypothetical protein